jgi:hypothetical protein
MQGGPQPVGPESLLVMVQRIALYWRANPLAGDSTEGITQWWLGMGPASNEAVGRALQYLEALGLVEGVRSGDGRTHYRRTSLDPACDADLDRLIAMTTLVKASGER